MSQSLTEETLLKGRILFRDNIELHLCWAVNMMFEVQNEHWITYKHEEEFNCVVAFGPKVDGLARVQLTLCVEIIF
jgi:hypothetical protein